jgi:ornithine carbamoyltransferase
LKALFAGEATNLCHSWCEAAAVLDIALVQVCPEGFEVDPAWLATLSPELPSRVSVARSLHEAVVDADIVYTDCWPAPEEPSARAAIAERFLPLQVTADVLARAPADALFLPCPPVTRGEEVSSHRWRIRDAAWSKPRRGSSTRRTRSSRRSWRSPSTGARWLLAWRGGYVTRRSRSRL